VGGIVRSFQDSHNRNYFLPYNATTNPDGYPAGPVDNPHYYGYVRLQTMLRAAVVSVSSGIPGGLNVDSDSDGNVDNVTFVVQGNASGWGQPLWPHWWTLHLPTAVYINSKRVWDYNMQLSSSINTGVICHEMSHSMGFPDLYHYVSNGIAPVGAWDLMQSDQNPPQHHLTYMKWKYGGWFASIPTITPTATPTQYTLTSIDQSPFGCYKIASSLTNQYYVVEYRRKTGTYENSLPGTGLIIYRIISSFGGSPVNGNASGPPDEVYIYRPNGTISVNGTIDDANYSATVNRTSIHDYTNPQPWLYSNTHTMLDGNLVITDIGFGGNNTITFKVGTAVPNVWTGASSTSWHTAANWSKGTVPTSTEYVEIPSPLTRYPTVTSNANAKQVTLKNGATLTISTGTLTIAGNFENYGTLAMTNNAAKLYVQEDLIFRSGSSTNITAASSEIFVKSDVEFHEGSNVVMTSGYLEFYGTDNSYFRTYTASTINQFRSNKTSPAVSGFSAISTATLTINAAIYVYNGSTLTHPYSGTTILKSNLNVYAGGSCTMNGGTLSIEGIANSSITFTDAGSYLNHLRINKSMGASVSLSTDVAVNGNLTIQTGILNASSRTLYVKGNWTNNVGVAAFLEGASTVVLNGSGTQTMTTENFNNLVLNKTSGIMSIPGGVTVTCASYDWTAGAYTVSGGVFTVGDLVDPGIMGTITLSSGTINYTQDTSQYIDLRANLTISGGTFNVNGGNSAMWFSYVDVATLNLSGSGVLDIKNVGIYIPSGTAFNGNITGGTIRTVGSFTNNRADFNPTGGTIELYGSVDCTLSNTAGSNFHHILINKSATRGEETNFSLPEWELARDGSRIPITRTNQVTGSGPIDINGNFTLQAGTFVAPAEMNIAGNWVNQVGPAAFTEGTGTVIFDGSGHQYCNYSEIFNILVINKSGGALRVNSSSAVVTCATYTWFAGAVDVLVGTFTANDLSQNGIYGNFYVNPGGTINLSQDSSQWIDLNGFFHNYGGTINVYGGSMSCYLAFDANAGIEMTNGNIYIRDWGILITNRPYTLDINITGGFLRAKGSFSDSRGGVVFGGGTVDLYGPGAHTVSLGTGSRFYNLSINKTETRTTGLRNGVQTVGSHGRFETLDLRENSITAASNLLLYGSLTVGAGIFNVSSRTITVYNDLAVWSTLRMLNASGMLDVWDDVIWQPTSVSDVTTGTIHCGGNWTFANGCTVDLTGNTARLDAYYGANLTNNSPTAKFGHLEIFGTEEEPEFMYLYSSASNYLLVEGNLTVYSENTLNLNEGNCTVAGNTQIEQTGTIIVGDGGTLIINGNLNLYGNLITGPGSAIVHGLFNNTSNGSLVVAGGLFKNDAPWADPWVVYLACAVNINSGMFEITHKTLSIQAHATRIFNNATVRVGMGFIATAANCYLPWEGGLYMIGTGNPVLQVSGTNHISHLYVQKSALANTVYLQNDTVITGNVNLQTGKLNANNFNLTVGGNWANTAGTSDFSPGTGTVTFNKTGGLQTISGPINFYNVVDNHTGSALDFQGPTGINGTLTVNAIVTFQNTATLATVFNSVSAGILAFYNNFSSTIASYTGGGAIRSFNAGNHVTIGDLTQNGLYGSWVANGGHLEVHQDYSNWIDLNGAVEISNNGILDIYGGNMSCYISYAGNASLTMSSGEFNVKNWGIVISNNPYTCTFNITGGTITSNTGFYDYRGNFTPTGGTVKFEGSADGTVFTTAPSHFHHLLVNKVVTRDLLERLYESDHSGNSTALTRDGTLSLSGTSYFTVNGDFTIQNANMVYLANHFQSLDGGNIIITAGTFNISNYQCKTSGNITVSGELQIHPMGSLQIGANKTLSINNGGLFQSLGSLANYATVTRSGTTGTYVFNVESGGTIGAYNTIFEYMGTNGINVKNGALVDGANAFTYCTFRNGASGGKLLTINNNQTFSIDNALFPANTWGGTYNVSKTANQGHVTFTNFSGDFSGSSFEQDAYNRIDWEVAGVPEITDLMIERYGVNNIRLYWTYPHPFTNFKIYASDSPEGPFTHVATSVITQWNGSATNPRAFYRVTAVLEP